MKKTSAILATASICFSQQQAFAEKHEDHQFHGAHVHGLSELTLAIEGKQVEIEFISPSANILGYEHRARTSEQIKALNAAQSTLENADELFGFIGTDCSLNSKHIDLAALRPTEETEEHGHKDEHDHHDEHGHKDEHDHHDEHGHKDEHDHHEEHGHKDEHGHDKHDKESHSEITAEYTFSCQDTASLSQVRFDLFKQFPAIETLNVQWISNSGQGGAKLNKQMTTLDLK